MMMSRLATATRLNPELPEEIKAVVIEEWSGRVDTKSAESEETVVLTIPAVRQALALYVRRGLGRRVFGSVLHQVWLPSITAMDD